MQHKITLLIYAKNAAIHTLTSRDCGQYFLSENYSENRRNAYAYKFSASLLACPLVHRTPLGRRQTDFAQESVKHYS